MSKENFVAMTRCFLCGEGNEILLNTRLRDMSAYHNKVLDKRPCPKCEGYMKQGVILISVADGEESDNPFKTGGFAVVKETVFEEGSQARIKRCAFVPNSMWRKLGLPDADKLHPGPGVEV